MRNRLTGVCLICLVAAAAHAAVDGAVVNRTTGRPQAGATVTLLSMGDAGMAVKATVHSDAAGRFRIDQPIDGPHLLQAAHQGVTYNRMLQPGSPSTGLTIDVYGVSDKPGLAKVLRHVVLLQPSGVNLSVRENILLRNSGKETFLRPEGGTFRFYVPEPAAESLRVSSRSATGLPLEQAAVETGERGVYQVSLPIKPGDTQLDLSYSLPFRSPGEFASKTLQSDVPVRLLVPAGATLEGQGVSYVGTEQKSQASNYAVATREYRVMVTAVGAPTAEMAESTANDSTPTQILPRVYQNVYLILGLAFAALSLGFIRLYGMNVAVKRVRKVA